MTSRWTAVTVAALLSGCAATSYDTWYRISVSGNHTTETPLAGWTKDAPSASQIKAVKRYEDENLEATWTLWDWNIKMKVQNKTDLPMTIHWADSRIVWDGQEDRMQNKDERTQRGSVVPRHSTETYHVYPSSLLQWTAWGDPGENRGQWRERGSAPPVFGLSFASNESREARERRARGAIGHSVFILLPVEVAQERVNYRFRLDILDARNYGVRY